MQSNPCCCLLQYSHQLSYLKIKNTLSKVLVDHKQLNLGGESKQIYFQVGKDNQSLRRIIKMIIIKIELFSFSINFNQKRKILYYV